MANTKLTDIQKNALEIIKKELARLIEMEPNKYAVNKYFTIKQEKPVTVGTLKALRDKGYIFLLSYNRFNMYAEIKLVNKEG